jgi:4-hydroxy-tetrahydrodipicolinate synthase
LVEYHIQSGTDALVVAGTTGESVTLSEEELFALFDRTLAYCSGRIPVIAGCGSNNTAHAKQIAKQISRLGVAAGLSVTPYYNKPTQEGLYQHYAAIGEYSGLPQILYNVPGRTGCDLQPETVARLAGNFGICGIKEATGNLSRVAQLRELCGRDFALYSVVGSKLLCHLRHTFQRSMHVYRVVNIHNEPFQTSCAEMVVFYNQNLLHRSSIVFVL